MNHKNENPSCANGFGSLTNITEKGNDMAEANYTDFLKQKIKMATFKGFQAKSGELSPVLYPHQLAEMPALLTAEMRRLKSLQDSGSVTSESER